MFYITTTDSETGKKLNAALKKCKEAIEKARETAAFWGTQEYLVDRWVAAGGIEALNIIPELHNSKNWRESKEVKGYFLPDQRTKEGKRIQKLFNELPRISRREINLCIGWDERWKLIGVNQTSEYIGFTTNQSWKIKIPKDCKEITSIEYGNIFNKEFQS